MRQLQTAQKSNATKGRSATEALALSVGVMQQTAYGLDCLLCLLECWFAKKSLLQLACSWLQTLRRFSAHCSRHRFLFLFFVRVGEGVIARFRQLANWL